MRVLRRVVLASASSLCLAFTVVGCTADNPGLVNGDMSEEGGGDGGGKLPDLGGNGNKDLSGTNSDGAPPTMDATTMGGDGPMSGGDMTAPADLTMTPDMAGTCGMASMSCYNGPNGTAGKGACQNGTAFCSMGIFGPCIGEIDPNPESCNGVDDDCNGMVDDGLGNISCGVGACVNTVAACTNGKPTACMPKAAGQEKCGNGIDDDCNGLVDDGCGCVYVSPNGSDMNGTGQINAPFRTIGKGIASAGANGLPNIVCVASGNLCPSNFTYNETVTMRDGVSVYGGYGATVNMWTRNAGCVTTIADQSANGVTFDDTVKKQTILDGFTINGQVAGTSAAVSILGSTGATVSDCTITGAGTMTSYGVNITDMNNTGATPSILRCGISGGNGTTLSIGVHSLNSAPTIRGNCDTIDPNTGRCTSNSCFLNIAPTRFIRARNFNGNGTESYGVRLESSPNTTVEQNSICGTGASADEAGVRLSGDGTNVLLHANMLGAAGTSMNAVGFWADPCAGASPWVLDNNQITGNSTLMMGRADGVRAIGDCHPRIDSNALIVGGVESANNDANGVFCVKDQKSMISSRCTVLNNTTIQGSGGGFPPISYGVHCDDGACARIENNTLITAHGGQVGYGVYLLNTGTFVNNNHIDAGCSTTIGVGLEAENSFARVQNNVVTGSVCPNNQNNNPSYGVRVVLSAGNNEVDLHSNDLFGGGNGGNMCTSRGLGFDVMMGGQPPMPSGVVRNNIIYAGTCATRYSVEEVNASADPRLFENNDLWSANGQPTALYRDEAMTNMTMLAQVNALMMGPAATANINADPMFGNGFHLPNNSPCVNAGTATGAPTTDFDGDARPQQGMFDIGADEYKP
jgi:hypothetical protein